MPTGHSQLGGDHSRYCLKKSAAWEMSPVTSDVIAFPAAPGSARTAAGARPGFSIPSWCMARSDANPSIGTRSFYPAARRVWAREARGRIWRFSFFGEGPPPCLIPATLSNSNAPILDAADSATRRFPLRQTQLPFPSARPTGPRPELPFDPQSGGKTVSETFSSAAELRKAQREGRGGFLARGKKTAEMQDGTICRSTS